MRRSLAPSSRKIISDAAVSPTKDKIGTRSTKSVLNLLENDDGKENNTSDNVVEDNSLIIDDDSPKKELATNKIVYKVVWGKRSTKKHKTFEEDGTLTVGERTITLSDMDGNRIGSSSLAETKISELIEGSQVIVGNKEVGILERLQENTITVQKRTIVDKVKENESPSKKKKYVSQAFFKPNLFMVTSKVKGVFRQKMSIHDDFEPLIMPEPTYQHQWKHNKNKDAVTKVSVAGCLARNLRPHQREGVIFLYECLLGMRHTDENYYGAILADDMGLGKSVQCISACYTLLKQGPYSKKIANRILIVAPSSLTSNWEKEIHKWLGKERVFTQVIDAKSRPSLFASQCYIPFMIISYDLFVRYFEEIKTIRFDIMVCDEGHRLKNSTIKAATLLNNVNCQRRIILTGTPIQNDLQEFFALVNFVNPGILGTYNEYKKTYENPIVLSQQPNVLPIARELGAERAKQLNELTSKFVLRRTEEINRQYLPKKQEFVVFCKPSALQLKLLRHSLEFYANQHKSPDRDVLPLQLITILKKICSHPSLLTITNNKDCLTEELKQLLPQWNKMCPRDSGKLSVMQSVLQELIELKEKIVIVSNHTTTLDMLMGLCNHFNYKYCRLDGQTQSVDRNKIVEKFNKPNNDVFVFLLSAKAGGVGLNLIGASRLVLFDNDWNPATDLQAMSRIWRDGQKRNVYIYRLVTVGSIEEKVFQRQVSKTSLCGRVVDKGGGNEKNLKFSDEELRDLFSIRDNDELVGCPTHDLLRCECTGQGEIPDYKVLDNSSSDDRGSFKLTIDDTTSDVQSLKMHELMQWEHHSEPIKKELLEEMCLTSAADDIQFIFRNQNNQHELNNIE